MAVFAIMLTVKHQINFLSAKRKLKKLDKSANNDDLLNELTQMILDDLHELNEKSDFEQPQLFMGRHLFILPEYESKRKDISTQVRILKKILETRGLLRWLSYRMFQEGLDDAYTISRTQLAIRLIERRIEFNRLILSRLEIRQANIHESEYVVDRYEFTHPDSTFKLNNNRIYLLQGNLGGKLYFSLGKHSQNKQDLVTRTLLARLVLWNSKHVLTILREKPELYENEWTKMTLGLFPDFKTVYESTKRISVKFHPNSTKGLDESNYNEQSFIDSENEVEIWHQRFIIKDDTWLVIDSTCSPYTEYVAGHWQFLEQSKLPGSAVHIVIPKEQKEMQLNQAIFLMGRADENWYHLLLDTLPRYILLRKVPNEVPVLVRADIPKSSIEFISKLVQHKIIFITPDIVVKVRKLYFVASRSTVFDSKPPIGEKQVHFPKRVYRDLKELVLSVYSGRKDGRYATHIYFPRNAKYRNINNAVKIENLMQRLGFKTIHSDSQFYKDQFNIFNNANFVVSPGGAILANIIFMNQDSMVVAFRSTRDNGLDLWKKLAEACDVTYAEVVGFPTYYGPGFLARQHSNYYLSPKKVEKVCKQKKAIN